ncbi:MAG: preQ(1) synthase [Rhodothermia bacterium]|nr:preQ(1) synthase [Rhodothermia bacterium]
MNQNENPINPEYLKKLQADTLAYTEQALAYMARYNIVPEGRIELFRAPDTRQQEINRMPYPHKTRQVVTYETEKGEFSALCPFSGLPDYGTIRIEYVPKSWVLELKSLKYYLMSWRQIGVAQEDITAYIYEDLKREMIDAEYLVVHTVYNVRGGINTICEIDSRKQP